MKVLQDYASLEERLKAFLEAKGCIHKQAYIAKQSALIGDVRVDAYSSIWPFVAARADLNYIQIGSYTNIQEGAVLHLAESYPLIVGKGVTVGHKAILHACTVQDHCLIGMHATVLDGAIIGTGSIIGAGALVTQGSHIPPRSMVLGIPAKVVRSVSDAEYLQILESAQKYALLAEAQKALGKKSWF